MAPGELIVSKRNPRQLRRNTKIYHRVSVSKSEKCMFQNAVVNSRGFPLSKPAKDITAFAPSESIVSKRKRRRGLR